MVKQTPSFPESTKVRPVSTAVGRATPNALRAKDAGIMATVLADCSAADLPQVASGSATRAATVCATATRPTWTAAVPPALVAPTLAANLTQPEASQIATAVRIATVQAATAAASSRNTKYASRTPTGGGMATRLASIAAGPTLQILQPVRTANAALSAVTAPPAAATTRVAILALDVPRLARPWRTNWGHRQLVSTGSGTSARPVQTAEAMNAASLINCALLPIAQ